MRLIIGFLLFYYSFVFAEELPFVHYTPDKEINPLPSASIMQSFQDSHGYMWFAVVSSGLVRFDGYKMERYLLEDGLPDLSVTGITEDTLGYLWVSTDNGMAVSSKVLKDYSHGEKIHFVTQVNAHQLYRNAVTEGMMVSGKHGSIWIATANDGVFRYQRTHLSVVDVIKLNAVKIGIVDAITTLRNGKILIGSHKKNQTQLFYVDATSNFTKADIKVSNHCIISKLFESRNEQLWIGCQNGLIWSASQPDHHYDVVNNRIMDFMQTRHGDIWVASQGSGVVRIDVESYQKTLITRKNGLLSDVIRDVMQDKENNIWISQSSGLSKLRSNYKAFVQYTAKTIAGQKPDLPNAEVFSIFEENLVQGGHRIWAGTAKGTAIIEEAKETQWFLPFKDLGVQAICHAGTDKLWFGSKRGVFLYDTHKKVILTFQPMGEIYYCYSQSVADDIMTWFSGNEKTFVVFKNRWFEFGYQSGLPLSPYYSVAQDDDGKTWLASGNNGVFRSQVSITPEWLNKQDHHQPINVIQELVFENVWNVDKGASTNITRALIYSDHQMWVGTSKGLDVLSMQPVNLIAAITRKNGLLDDNVYSMDLSPVTHHIWAGTNRGLAEIDPTKKAVIRTVTKKEGLIDNEVWAWNSVKVGTDGVVYFGTPKGLSAYRHQLDTKEANIPTLYFSKIIFNQDYFGNNELMANYVGLGFSNDGNIKYQTRLTGYEADWSEITKETKLRYTNLPAYFFAKYYTLEVVAQNENGPFTPQSLQYQFIVNPPWWLQWWFVFIVAVVIVALFYLFDWLHTRNLEKRNRELARLNNELVVAKDVAEKASRVKTAFLRNMSHELRTPLNAIIGYSEILEEDVEEAGDTDYLEDIQSILNSARHLSGMLNQVLETAKMESSDGMVELEKFQLLEMIQGAFVYLKPAVKKNNNTIKVEYPDQSIQMFSDKNKLELIILNILNNAAKFTQNGMIHFKVSQDEDSIVIVVTDTGVGINEEVMETIFDPFMQADISSTREYDGTGLGLYIVKRYCDILKGTIEVTSQPNEGCTVIVKLPINLNRRDRDH